MYIIGKQGTTFFVANLYIFEPKKQLLKHHNLYNKARPFNNVYGIQESYNLFGHNLIYSQTQNQSCGVWIPMSHGLERM